MLMRIFHHEHSVSAFVLMSPSSSSISSSFSTAFIRPAIGDEDVRRRIRLFMVASLDKATDGATTEAKAKKASVRTFRFPNSTIDNDIVVLEDEWYSKGPSFFFDFPITDETTAAAAEGSSSVEVAATQESFSSARTQSLEFDIDTGRLRLGCNGLVLLDGIGRHHDRSGDTNDLLSGVTDTGDHRWTSIKTNALPSDLDEEDSSFSSVFLQARLPTVHPSGTAPPESFDLDLGRLLPSTSHRLLACARINRYWMGPSFGSDDDGSDVPHDTQFLLVEIQQDHDDESSSSPSKDPLYALILPMVHAGFRATVQASSTVSHFGNKDNDRLKVICYSETGGQTYPTTDSDDDGHINMLALHVSIGDNPFALLKRAFREVADTTGTFQTLDRKAIPASVDDFGWCTWDAFYSNVTPRGILKGVRTLVEGGVPPRKIILDDGWQQVAPYPTDWSKENGRAIATTTSSGRAAMLGDILDPIVSAVADAATSYYVTHVQNATFGSIHLAIWTYLSKTVLKQGLWEFFDSQNDFARQLDGFEPNFKFNTRRTEINGDNSDDDNNDASILSLKDLVTKLKTELDVKNVYCWHAIHGYWRGVSTKLGESIGITVSQVHPKAAEHLLRVDPQAAFDPPSLFGVGMITNADDLDTFYRHIHGTLVEAGVDGVKVDVQSGVTAAASGIGPEHGSPAIARLYTQAMERSVAHHFASSDGNGAVNCINCMCHSTENLYRYQKTAVARASEDFFPDRPETHSVHLVNVAYNSLFLGEICLPDWDMFHSKHESAELHAAARAIGGCPVYVSDVPGEHDVGLLKKLVLPDGSILRAALPGRPTLDCLFADVGRDGTSALKIWNQNRAGGGVVGAFHVQGVAWNFETNGNQVLDGSPAPLTATVRPHDVDTLRRGSDSDAGFAVWSHKSESLQVLGKGSDSITVLLEHRDFDLFTFAPIQRAFEGTVRWAPIGLANMMNSGGALEYAGPLEQTTTTTSENKIPVGLFSKQPKQRHRSTTVDITTRGPGRFVAYCIPAPSSILIGNRDNTRSSAELAFSYDKETGQLTFELPPESDGTPHRITVAWDDESTATNVYK